MNINQRIEEALYGITESIWPLKCPNDSPPEMYIVYNPELESPGYFADDKAQEWDQYMQIHLYKKGNYIESREEIRRRLEDNGFVCTGIETMYEEKTRYNHLCFECYAEEE